MWVTDYLSGECGVIIHTGPYYTDLSTEKNFISPMVRDLAARVQVTKYLLSIFRNKISKGYVFFLASGYRSRHWTQMVA